MWPSKNDVLMKSVTFSWKKWLVIDRKYDGPFGVFWVNFIFENNKLIFRTVEKSNVDKNVSDLQKELFKYLGR